MSAIDKIRQELTAATPGPWRYDRMRAEVMTVATSQPEGYDRALPVLIASVLMRDDDANADATLIAHAPTYLAALCDVAEAADKLVHRGDHGTPATTALFEAVHIALDRLSEVSP